MAIRSSTLVMLWSIHLKDIAAVCKPIWVSVQIFPSRECEVDILWHDFFFKKRTQELYIIIDHYQGPMNRSYDYQILDFLQNTNLLFEYTSVPVWHSTSCSGLPPPWHWSLPRIWVLILHDLGEVVSLLSKQKNLFCLPLLFLKKSWNSWKKSSEGQH